MMLPKGRRQEETSGGGRGRQRRTEEEAAAAAADNDDDDDLLWTNAIDGRMVDGEARSAIAARWAVLASGENLIVVVFRLSMVGEVIVVPPDLRNLCRDRGHVTPSSVRRPLERQRPGRNTF